MTAFLESGSWLVTWEKSPLSLCAAVTIADFDTSIPFNLWRACHWYNKLPKRLTRPSKEDYKYYFKHNVYITTSGNFNMPGLKFCIEVLGADRCLYSIGKTRQRRVRFDHELTRKVRHAI